MSTLGTSAQACGWRARAAFASAVLAFAGWLGAAAPARAEVAAADPIDVAMRQCLARRDRSSTVGQIQCMDEARTKWLAAVDEAFQQLTNVAPPAARRGWQESQRRWLLWRKDETLLTQAVYATTSGTMYAMASADMRIQPVRDRALSLRDAADRYARPNGGADAVHRVRACSDDAACEHALFDLNRYYVKLQKRMPARSRPMLVRAQRAWVSFRDGTTPMISEEQRVDLIGARVATLKRLSETVNNK
ncbi:lysozyme inhibitor LprI family protein [Burkholderia gladioli]|uniref:lysozyme inhibitor LprI family protein n=1 Tax=Burkholderia gladioli TaxID=28095 RepID=UPI001640DA23|nr:lysozyme inhibitor LprI family protein [Burkholderia gladioli]